MWYFSGFLSFCRIFHWTLQTNHCEMLSCLCMDSATMGQLSLKRFVMKSSNVDGPSRVCQCYVFTYCYKVYTKKDQTHPSILSTMSGYAAWTVTYHSQTNQVRFIMYIFIMCGQKTWEEDVTSTVVRVQSQEVIPCASHIHNAKRQDLHQLLQACANMNQPTQHLYLSAKSEKEIQGDETPLAPFVFADKAHVRLRACNLNSIPLQTIVGPLQECRTAEQLTFLKVLEHTKTVISCTGPNEKS